MGRPKKNPEVEQISTAIKKPEKQKESKIVYSTGCDLLDLVVGGGVREGFPGGKIINIVGDKSSGKCLKNSYILNEKGLIKIDLIGRDLPYGTTNKSSSISITKNLQGTTDKFWKEKVHKTIKISTSNGFEIEGTPDHSILTLNKNCEYEMKKLSELTTEDVCIISKGNNIYSKEYFPINYTKIITSTNHIPIKVPNIVNENIGTFLGYYIADGNIVQDFVVISSSKEYCRKEISTIIKNEFGIEAHQKYNNRSTITNREFVHFLKYILDYPEKSIARNKEVPPCILNSPKSVQISFLKALIDNDGSKSNKSNSLNYYTASEELAKQIHLMLLNIGIYSSLNKKNGAFVGSKFYNHTYYTIRIGGTDLKLYAELIGSNKYDFTKTLKIKEDCSKSCIMNSIPFLKEKMKKDISILRKKLNWSINGKIPSYNGITRFPRYLFAGKVTITISLLKDFIDKFTPFFNIFNIDFYKEILYNDYRYVSIKNIKEVRKETDVYDFHVPKDHLFWSNGFISHNTFICTEMVASAYHKYKDNFDWKYDDCESGFSFDTKKLYGFSIIPLNKEEMTKSETVEDLYCNVRDFIEQRKKQAGIYGVDSLDGLSSEEGDDLAEERYKAHKKGKKLTKGSFRMKKPYYLSQEFFPQLTDKLEKTDSLLIIISQVRQNVDPMSFEKYTRAGGKALDFFAHTVIWLAQVCKVRKKDRVIGVTIKAKTTKSKTARPYRECFFTVYFDYGIDNITSNIDFLYDFRTDSGKVVTNAKGEWDGKEFTREKLIDYIRENHLEAELKNRTVAKWNDIEESIKLNWKGKYE